MNKKIDYTIKEEYDLGLISDEYLYILQEKNKGKSFEEIAEELGQTWVNVRTKAKSAIDILQGKKPSKKICQNCGKQLNDSRDGKKYCDDCYNGNIYISGHDKEEYGELKVNAVYLHKGYLYAECTCSCGKKREVRYSSLKSGKTTSCGHVGRNDLTGEINKYGIKALYSTGEKKQECYVWRCLCTCGREFDVVSNQFPNRKSCGHAHDNAREVNIKKARKESDKYLIDGTNVLSITSKLYKNNTSGYKGVKWIKKEQKWYVEITFKGKRYYLGRYYTVEDAAMVRKIAEEHTHKDFLKWFEKEFPLLYKKISDRSELSEEGKDVETIREIRAKNRKNTEWVLEYKGKTKTLKEWCVELGKDYNCVRQRIKTLGWSVEKAFETPVRERNKNTK